MEQTVQKYPPKHLRGLKFYCLIPVEYLNGWIKGFA